MPTQFSATPAGQAEVFQSGRAMHVPGDVEHSFLGDQLDARREIHVALRQLALCLPRRTAEEAMEAVIGHGETLAVIEVTHVEVKRPIVFEIDEMLADQVGKTRLAVGREAHEFVFAGIDAEAAVVSERAVKQSE